MDHYANIARDRARACADLRKKIISSRENIEQIDKRMRAEQNNIQDCMITIENLKDVPTSARTYEYANNLLTLVPLPNVREHLQEKIETGRKKVQELRTSKEVLERTLKEAEDILRELCGPSD